MLQFSSKAKPLVRGTAICDDSVPTSVLPEVKVITTPAPDSDDSPCEYNSQPPLLGQVRLHLFLGGDFCCCFGWGWGWGEYTVNMNDVNVFCTKIFVLAFSQTLLW